jgi:hypothetical protein
MKQIGVFLSILLMFVVSSCSKDQNNSNAVEIERLLANPASFVGQTIQIQGVVNLVNPEKQLFSIISQREFKECGIGSCNVDAQLPIRYHDPSRLPQVGKRIQIVGKISQVSGGFVYEADSIKDVEDISGNE